jgi:integrase
MSEKKAAVRITKRTIDAAAPGASRYELWDADLKGFGLRVEPSGAKSFIVRYRAGAGGRSAPKRFVSLGRYGHLTPEEARRMAREVLGAAAQGEDPAAHRDNRRKAATVSELAQAFLSEHVETKRKPATISLYRHALNNHALPELGRRKAEDITRADIARLHHKLRDRPFLANRIVAVLGSMFSWGAEHGKLPEGFNPTRKLEMYREDKRERFLSVDELERLGAAIREAETRGLSWDPDTTKVNSKHAPKAGNRRVKIGAEAAAAIRLLLLTGARLREILHLKWEYVDLERGLLLLPDSKTGRKTIVLNTPALSVLGTLQRVSTYVIPGEDSTKPRSDLKRPWAAVSFHAGLSGVRLHDLRHTHASFGAGSGMGLPILGKLLGHTQSVTTARYAHLDADPLRRASNKIGEAIAAALDGKKQAEVVPLRRETRVK